MTTQDQSFTDHNPRVGGVDVDTWRAIPDDINPDGRRTGRWNVVAGDLPDEADVWITVKAAEYPKDVAEFIVAAVRAEAARQQSPHIGQVSVEQRDERAVDLPRNLVDNEDCRFDHHGGCQAHGYLALDPGERCPQAEAKEFLFEIDRSEAAS